MGKGRSRLRYSNRTKVLLCYLAAFGLPVLWMLALLLCDDSDADDACDAVLGISL